MAQFEIELENGHKYQVDADTEEQAVMAAKGEDGGTTTAVGAFTRSAATGVVPAFGALGGAAIGQAVIPIPVVGALVGGLAGSVGANVLQRQALKIAAPETAQRLAELEQADVQQHPYASFAGRFVSPSPAFQIAPKAAIQGLRAIPAALRAGASEEVKKLATQGATQAGLAVGTSAVIPMMPESLGGAGRLPTLGEVAEGTAQMMFYGKGRRIRAPRLPLSEGEVEKTPGPPPPDLTTPLKGVEDAIQERSPAPLPVEVSTGRGPEVGGQVRDAEALAQAQAQEVAPKPPEVQPDVRVKQLRDRIEAVRAPRMSQDELDRIFNKGDEQAKLGREKVEQEADQKAAELLKDVSDDDLVDLMGNDNRDDIFAGEEPSPLMANGAKDYAAIEWLRRRKAKQPDVRVETPSPSPPKAPEAAPPAEPAAPDIGLLTPDEAVRQGVNRGDYNRAVDDAFRQEKITEEQWNQRNENDPKKWPSVKVGDDVFVPMWNDSGKVTDVGYGWVEVMDRQGRKGKQNPDIELLSDWNKRREETKRPTIEPAAPATEKPKEPWEMTKAEWAKQSIEQNKSIDLAKEKQRLITSRREVSTANVDEQMKRLREAKKNAEQGIPDADSMAIHRQFVAARVASGKPINTEVLADYPDLKPAAPTAEAAREAKVEPTADVHAQEVASGTTYQYRIIKKGDRYHAEMRMVRDDGTTTEWEGPIGVGNGVNRANVAHRFIERYPNVETSDADMLAAKKEIENRNAKIEAEKQAKAKEDQALRERQDAYDKEIESRKLPTGKKGAFEYTDEEGGKHSQPATLYGDLAIHKSDSKYDSTPYKVSHVPSGQRIGSGFATQAQAKRFIKSIQHLDLSKKKPSNEVLAQVKASLDYMRVPGEPPGSAPLGPTEAGTDVKNLYENSNPTQADYDSVVSKLTPDQKKTYANALGAVARRIEKAADVAARNERMSQPEQPLDLQHPPEESIITKEPKAEPLGPTKSEPEPTNQYWVEFTKRTGGKDRLGPFPTRETAEKVAEKWREGEKGYPDSSVVVEPKAKDLGTTQGAGPGTPSLAQGPDPKAQIEQLADGFKGSKAPLGDRVKALVQGSYTLGEKLTQVKDAVARALSGLKTTGDALRKTIMGFDSVDDMLKAKGELSSELEKRGWRVRAFVQTVKRAIPDLRRRNAIAKWVDAGGDTATLQQGLAATKPKYRQAYQDALNLKGDDLIHAQNIQNYFESRLQEAISAGVLEHGIADYLHRIYPKDSPFKQRALAYVQSGILSAHPSLARKRVFHFDWEAEQAGYQPIQDFLPRIAEYETSLSRAIAAREFIAKLTQMKAPDGRPIIGIKGVGVPIEDPVTGERTGTVIKPLGDFKKASDPNDPLNYRGDYKDKEYPALSKWKWVASDAADKPIFLKGDVAIHPAYAGRIEALLEPSHVRYGRYPRLGQALLGIGSTFKNTMLDISGFHHVQIALHAMEHRVMPWQIMKDIDFENKHVQGLLRGGVTLGGEYRESHLGEGLMGGTLTRHIPGVGPILEAYHSYLFQSLIPRIKMTMALDALERNSTRFAEDLASGKMKESDLYHLTANEANAAFGEQNYIMLERSKTAQDMLRLIFLAPDFLEARGRFAGQAFTKYGTEQRMALALGAVTMYTLARIINKALDDQYHFEPENLFNVVYKGNSYGLRTVQGDILHLIEKPVQFWMSRLNPVYGRAAMEMATGRDWFGRKRSFPEQVWDTVSNIVPIAVRSNRERSMWESALNAFGVTARRYNDVDDAFKLAQKWKAAHGVHERGEFIYDPDKDPLRSLKIALSRQDEAGSMKEIQKLIQNKATTMYKLNQYFQRYAAMPFTGSRINDRKFITSLSEDERKTVESGRQTKQRILKLFRTARNQYLASIQAATR